MTNSNSQDITMKKILIFSSIVLLTALTGCQPRFSFENRKISIITTPPGAEVYQINSAYRHDTFLGTTPIKNQPVSVLSRVKGRLTSTDKDWFTSQINMINVRIEKEGYKTYRGNLATDPEETIKHTIPLSKD